MSDLEGRMLLVIDTAGGRMSARTLVISMRPTPPDTTLMLAKRLVDKGDLVYHERTSTYAIAASRKAPRA